MKKALRFVSIMLAVLISFSYIPQVIYSYTNGVVVAQGSDSALSGEEAEGSDNAVTTEEEQAVVEPNFTFPDELRAVTITPGKDYYKTTGQPDQTTENEIADIIEKINSFELNSIIINTSYDGKAYYSSSATTTPEENAVKMLIEAAKKSYLFVYVNLNINYVLNEYSDADLQSRIDYMTLIANRFSRDYKADGIILEGYYSSNSTTNYSYYTKNGSGIGFENWLLENGAYVFSVASQTIHKTDNSIPVGISIVNAWANSSQNENGSDTSDSFQALTDGYSDTVSYLKNGYADFIMLNTTGSLTDSAMPFKTVVEWWSGKAVDADIPLFVSHSNDKISSSAQGWALDDQVVKQLVELKKIPKYQGSSYNSYSQLLSNSKSTNAMIMYYQDKIDENSLLNELIMNAPSKTNFTTYEPTQTFQGTFDSNFEVTFNDKPIELNKAGYFYYEMPLDIGLNVFKIENKGKVVIYKITRKVQVLQSIEPEGTMHVDGGNTINVSAIAYKGSSVTATFNGKTISLKEVDGPWEGYDPNSSYTKYTGSFSAPQGKVAIEQNLGNIVISGSYKDISTESRPGSNVIVNALPEVQTPDVSFPNTADAVQGNPVISTPQTSVPTTLLKITNDCAKIYNETSSYAYPIPRTRLPLGTYDYLKSTVTYNGVKYYTTQSGRRFPASYATVVEGSSIANNNISFLQSSVENYDTIIKFKLNQAVPIEVSSSPCNYYSGPKGDYEVEYAATSITITFDYVAQHDYNVTLPSNSIFSGSSWSYTKISDNYYRHHLTLNLKKAGGYSGVALSYAADGTLTVRFNGHPSTLSGAIIALDPGHGFTAPGVNDPGAIGHVVERDINLAVAKLVEQKLKAAGATVYRLQTENTVYDTEFRADAVRQYKPDLFLSIHCNAAGSTATGSEAFYFHPFSQPFAKYLAQNVSSSLGITNRGDIYNEFWVTLQQEFPSSLVELAFVTNYGEAMKLADATYQNAVADAIVNAMAQYFTNN